MKKCTGKPRAAADAEQLSLFDGESVSRDDVAAPSGAESPPETLVKPAGMPAVGSDTDTRPHESPARMLDRLADWCEQGWLRRIDLEFARFLALHAGSDAGSGEDLDLVLLAAALCSWQLGRGHVCLDMKDALHDPEHLLALPAGVCRTLKSFDIERWQRACNRFPLLVRCEPAVDDARAPTPAPSAVTADDADVAKDDQAAGSGSSQPAGVCPLVRSGTRLYLWRYRAHEREIQQAIARRLMPAGMTRDEAADESLARGLALLFPPASGAAGAATDWQKIACALAARHRFGLITGGPGTGKTTTVVRLLALLQMQALREQGRFLRIGLAAPTGKAAARLNSSINGAIARLPLQEMPEGEQVRAAIPASVQTLHRLLGSQRHTRHFRHGRRNPLPLDVLVIDEASMVDLEMMAMLVQALPDETRLIVLGDKDQLASVEAGAILGELCSRVHAGHYWPETMAWIARVTGQQIDQGFCDEQGSPLDQVIAMLRHSHRFRSDSGIGLLAAGVNAGHADAVKALWKAQTGKPPAEQDIRMVVTAGDVLASDRSLRDLVVAGWGVLADQHEGALAVGYAHYLEVMTSSRPPDDADMADFEAWAQRVLAAHGRFQLLAALRRGPWGVDQLNGQIARWLQQQGLIPAAEGWYAGRPVMVTQNDYELGLMNGDVGITLAGRGQRLQVAFASDSTQAPVRWVSPSRLQAVETVFAMTVHKAQGSEFEHAALAMPSALSPVLTRELVYTAITRARRFFTLCGTPEGVGEVFDEAIRRRVHRASGLMAGMPA
ncbi:MAG: exodeoxyribonuclease V subunit alpha [Lautropia sp.]|nr:exodeoxyribonuclease V subunit alpha [Lautropia sp.]